MRWIGLGRAARDALLLLLAIGSPGVEADDGPKPGPKAADAVDRVLAEWQSKSSALTSVEVKFRTISSPNQWETTKGEGRAVLAAPNLALLELSSVDADGKAAEIKERTIWNGRSILQFDFAERKAIRFPIRTEWPSPPEPLCLPFFFRMTVEQAKLEYDWSLLLEDQDQIILKAIPRARPGLVGEKDQCFLWLDRKTFLPRKMIACDSKGQNRKSYEVLEIKRNAVEDLDGMKAPCLDAWSVVERDDWIVRLFLK